MPRIAGSAAVLLGLALGNGCARPAVQPSDSLDMLIAHLDSRIPRLLERYDVPGLTIVIVRGGEPVWSAADGYADVAHQRDMEGDAVFRAESISKAVTAWGVLRLVEQGRIGLDDPVQLHLGNWRLPDAEAAAADGVTIRRLLSHTAGLPLGPVGPSVEYAPGTVMPSLRDHLTAEARLVREPGATFLYSNVGYNLLELVIQEVTGRDFAEYMAHEVLLPLGMGNSSFGWEGTLDRALATGYDLRGAPVPAYVYPARASGGLFTTAGDVARFVSAGMAGPHHAGRRVLGPDGIRMLHSPQHRVGGMFALVADAYGLGHFLEELDDGRRAVWVGGQGHGWMTDFHAVPESGDAIVILTNSQRSWPLMAHLLNDWAGWAGVGPVKWSRLAHGVTALWVLIGLSLVATWWQVRRLTGGLRRHERRWAPLSQESRTRRALQAVTAATVLVILLWSAAQPYLMLESVFPGVTRWAGIACFGLASAVLGSALCPHYPRRRGARADGAVAVSKTSHAALRNLPTPGAPAKGSIDRGAVHAAYAAADADQAES